MVNHKLRKPINADDAADEQEQANKKVDVFGSFNEIDHHVKEKKVFDELQHEKRSRQPIDVAAKNPEQCREHCQKTEHED